MRKTSEIYSFREWGNGEGGSNETTAQIRGGKWKGPKKHLFLHSSQQPSAHLAGAAHLLGHRFVSMRLNK